jgi:hypothetical protein
LEELIGARIVDNFPNMDGKVCGTDELLKMLRALDATLYVKFAEYEGSDELSVCSVYAA